MIPCENCLTRVHFMVGRFLKILEADKSCKVKYKVNRSGWGSFCNTERITLVANYLLE